MIESYTFGKIVVGGISYRHDLKIIRNRVIPDWRRKNGHSVSADDIRDMIEAAPEVIILGTGESGRMKPDNGLADLLHNQKIKLRAVPTREAADFFNRLSVQGKSVAAGFHLTC